MKTKRLLLGVGILTAIVVLATLATVSSCGKKTWTKKEVDDWYARYGSMVRWVGYQGSDEQSHYFIARVMDDWAFIQIAKGELQVEHERPYSKPSSGQLYHYLVDPGKDFQKIGDKKGEQ